MDRKAKAARARNLARAQVERPRPGQRKPSPCGPEGMAWGGAAASERLIGSVGLARAVSADSLDRR